MTGELTPWEQKEKLEEMEEELRARGLPSPSDAVWDEYCVVKYWASFVGYAK